MTNEALKALEVISALVGKDDDLGQECLREIRAALTPEPVDVEGLKIIETSGMDYDDIMWNDAWNAAIDHLTTHYTLTPKGK